jgi:DNA-directed RNA polymerase specialized sigma24 family protein
VFRNNDADAKLTAEDFLKRLSADPVIAHQIHEKLTNLVKALILQKLTAFSIDFFEDDLQGLINKTFLIAYWNFSKGKDLDFSGPPESLQSYFWCIADNLCKEFGRQTYRSNRDISTSDEKPDGTELQIADTRNNFLEELAVEEERKVRADCYKKALLTLSQGDQHIIIPYYKIRTKTAEEKRIRREKIAADLGMSMDGIRVRINRIKKKIVKVNENCVRQHGFEPRARIRD